MGWYNTGGWKSGGWGYTPAGGGGGGGYVNSETTAWASQVVANGGTVSSAGNGAIVDTLISGLKSDGLFSILDRLFIHCLAGESSTQGLVSLVKNGAAVSNTIDATVVCTTHGGFTLDANGFVGNGTTGYLDTVVNASTAAANFAQNSNSFVQYIRNARVTADSEVAFGADDGTNVEQFLPYYTLVPAALVSVNSASTSSFSNTGNSQGQFGWSRTGTSAVSLIQNENAPATPTPTSSALANTNFFIGAKSVSGTATFFSADTIGATGFGGGMTNTQLTNLQHRINIALTSLGKNVY